MKRKQRGGVKRRERRERWFNKLAMDDPRRLDVMARKAIRKKRDAVCEVKKIRMETKNKGIQSKLGKIEVDELVTMPTDLIKCISRQETEMAGNELENIRNENALDEKLKREEEEEMEFQDALYMLRIRPLSPLTPDYALDEKLREEEEMEFQDDMLRIRPLSPLTPDYELDEKVPGCPIHAKDPLSPLSPDYELQPLNELEGGPSLHLAPLTPDYVLNEKLREEEEMEFLDDMLWIRPLSSLTPDCELDEKVPGCPIHAKDPLSPLSPDYELQPLNELERGPSLHLAPLTPDYELNEKLREEEEMEFQDDMLRIRPLSPLTPDYELADKVSGCPIHAKDPLSPLSPDYELQPLNITTG